MDTQDESTPFYAQDIHANRDRHTPRGKPQPPRQRGANGWQWLVGLLGGAFLFAAVLPRPEPEPTKSASTSRPAAFKGDRYSGGTIQREYMIEWVFASERERTATAASFAAPLLKNRGRDAAGRPTAKLKALTHLIATCISQNAKAKTVNHIRVSQVATRCIVTIAAPHLLEPRG